MKHEYHEGIEAAKRFEDTVKKLFKVPKSIIKMPVKRVRKPKPTSKD